MSSTDHDQRSTGEAPRGGALDLLTAAHGPNKRPSSTADKRSDTVRHPHVCEAPQKSGKPCGIINTKLCTDGHWRCRHHVKGFTVMGAGPIDTPPVTTITTKADARRYLAWLTKAAQAKQYNGAEVQALLRIVGMWNKVEERAEKGVREAFEALIERVKHEVRLLVKAREAYEDGHESRADVLVEEISQLRTEMKEELRRIAGMQAKEAA